VRADEILTAFMELQRAIHQFAGVWSRNGRAAKWAPMKSWLRFWNFNQLSATRLAA